MADQVKTSFETNLVTLPIEAILPLHEVSDAAKLSTKYRRIATSVKEVGIVEPPVVARPRDGDGRYLLLDGHMRLAIIRELGETSVRCLVSDDDESYTYNKRINALATIQEHYMIIRALERGVSEEKLGRALNVDPKVIRRRRSLLDGICPEVIELLKDKPLNQKAIERIKRMKPGRQIEAAKLMVAAGNYTSGYATALLAGTRQHDLVKPDQPKRLEGISPEQMLRIEREMESLQQDFKAVEESYGDDVLQLVIATGYLSKLVGNSEIRGYLANAYPEFLNEFDSIIASSSLDEAATTTGPEPLSDAITSTPS